MPSRIIKESITTSESLSEVSADAERLFWRLVVKADDFGLYYGNPRILASMCFPLDPPKEQKIRAWLSDWSPPEWSEPTRQRGREAIPETYVVGQAPATESEEKQVPPSCFI